MKSYFDQAMSCEQYESLLADNETLHKHHYDRCDISPHQQETIRAIRPFNILVLTEPWCGDSLAIFPVVKKMAETNGNWTIRVLLRDENLDLMDKFLTRGGRAVPIFLFLDDDYGLLFRWGPRPKVVQQIFEDRRAQIERGEVEKSEVIKKIRNFYAKDRGQTILNDLLLTIAEPI